MQVSLITIKGVTSNQDCPVQWLLESLLCLRHSLSPAAWSLTWLVLLVLHKLCKHVLLDIVTSALGRPYTEKKSWSMVGDAARHHWQRC